MIEKFRRRFRDWLFKYGKDECPPYMFKVKNIEESIGKHFDTMLNDLFEPVNKKRL